MEAYPFKFSPIYKERIWGGRNLERLFRRTLPDGLQIGESWELADLAEGVSVVVNGPEKGRTLTELTGDLGERLLGEARPVGDGRFPLLLKLLDANEILSLQVHPDAVAAGEIGGGAALKTECWYVLESRGGFIYKGLQPGVTPDRFAQAIESDTADQLVRRLDVKAGDFHYLPAGVVHALGGAVVVAEVQTPSDTTYRVTDWGRGREIHVTRAMQCIRFDLSGDEAPGAEGDRLVETEYFTVTRVRGADKPQPVAPGRCAAIMFTGGDGGVAKIEHHGKAESLVIAAAGQTVLLPACLKDATIQAPRGFDYLVITLPG